MLIVELVLVLRLVLAALALVILPLSFWGFFCFRRRGGQTVSNALRSVAFMIALSSGSFQWSFILGEQRTAPPGPGVLFSLVLIMATLVVCLFLLLRLRRRRAMEMARIEEHVDVALAIAELDILAPEEAQMYATECRRRIAEIMIGRGRARGE